MIGDEQLSPRGLRLRLGRAWRRHRSLRLAAWTAGILLVAWLVPPLVILLAAGLH